VATPQRAFEQREAQRAAAAGGGNHLPLHMRASA
jgi:hypothetical protein